MNAIRNVARRIARLFHAIALATCALPVSAQVNTWSWQPASGYPGKWHETLVWTAPACCPNSYPNSATADARMLPYSPGYVGAADLDGGTYTVNRLRFTNISTSGGNFTLTGHGGKLQLRGTTPYIQTGTQGGVFARIVGTTLDLADHTRFDMTVADDGLVVEAGSSVVMASGATTFDKTGPGVLVLAGSSAGQIALQAGTVAVQGNHAGGVSTAGGTDFGGAGQVGGATTIVGGAALHPGTYDVAWHGFGTGTLTFGSSLTMQSGSTFVVYVDGATNYSRAAVAGAVSIGGAQLTVSVATPPPAGTALRIIDKQGSGAVSGTFAGLPEGSVFSAGGGAAFRINYAAGTGNDVVLTAIAPPTVTTVAPAAGPAAGGQSVTITGTNLTGATAVRFGGTAATAFTVDSATQITATTPAHAAGAVAVAVTTPGGTGSKANAYTYVAAPTVTTVAPAAGPAAGGQSVTITGTNLTGATAVSFGGTAATAFTVNSATQITATTPAHAAGATTVAVTTPGGSGSKADAYTYVAAPTVTDVAPAQGPSSGGTQVTITGTNFAGATGVRFGGSVATFSVDSATRITATAPAHAAGAVAVTVSSPGGDGSLPGAYTYVAAPTVTGVAPDRGPVVGGTEVVVTGTDLAGASAVSFGGTPAMAFTVDSATRITAFAPAHAAGVVDIVVTTTGGASAVTEADRYTYVAPRRCHVRAGASGANDGSSWADAYTDLQAALAEAGCAEIWVARGVYRPVVPADPAEVTAAERAVSFRQRPLTALYGGFAGSEDALDQRDPAAQPTVLSGDLAGDDAGAVDGVDPLVPMDASADENSLHVLVMGGPGLPIDAATVLDGFILTGGHADGSGADGNGGALACDGRGAGNACSPTLARVVFSGNYAALDGGALHADGSDGGDASPVVDQALFRGNRAGCGGGASFVNGAGTNSPVIAHSTFVGNTASAAGGALCLRSATGGSGTPQLANVSFSGNVAGAGPGSGNGGAIHALAESAGALHPQIRNVTISGNHAGLDGGAIHLATLDGGVAAASLGNVVLWDDSATGAGPEVALAGGATATLAYGVVEGGCPAGVACSGAVITADPRLGALAGNGGATPTQLPGAGSSAVDAGDDATCEADDQRGLARPQGAHCDLGAVEAGPPSLTLVLDQAGPAWVTYGEVIDYVVRLVNGGEGAATNLVVQATFGGGADIGNTQWQCIPGSIGATCTAAGNGPINDSVTIPPGVSVTWLIHVPVSTSTLAGTLDFSFGAKGVPALHDRATIVLFRDGFEAGDSP